MNREHRGPVISLEAAVRLRLRSPVSRLHALLKQSLGYCRVLQDLGTLHPEYLCPNPELRSHQVAGEEVNIAVPRTV